MNDQSPDNLISAYFDGETTPTECEDAKRLLETSPEAKAEWEELEKLSQLISDVPRDRAPEEFPSEVMQHIERSMLLPDANIAPPVSSAARRRWLPTVVSLAVSAAALFLLVQLIGTSDQSQTKLANSPAATQSDDMGGGAVANSNTAADAVAMGAVGMDKGVPAEEAFDADGVAPAEASSHARTRPAKNAVATSSTRGNVGKQQNLRVAQPRVAEFKATRGGNQNRSQTESEKAKRSLSAGFGGGGSNLVFNSRMLEAAQIGQVVEALDRSSDQVTVVRLTVVDRRAGLEALKVLLARNQIPLDTENSEQADALSEGKKLTSAERSGDLIAMYVEATDVQLSSALKDLKKGGVFQELAVESAITVAQLENSARSRRGNAHYFRKAAVQSAVVADKPQTSERREKARESQAKDKSSTDRSRKPALAKSPNTKSPKNKKSNPRKRGFLADSKEAVVTKAKTTPDSESKVDQLARISRQLELSIPKDVLGGFLKKARKTSGLVGKVNTLARSAGIASKLSAAPQPKPASGGGKGQVAKSAKPLKVLIVLVAAPKNGWTSPTGPAARPAGKKADQAPPRKKDDGAAIFRRSPPHLS